MDIDALVEQSNSFYELEERLRHSGIHFRNSVQCAQYLLGEWELARTPELLRIANSGPAEATLPTIKVQTDRAEYYIHGIIHGTPGCEPSDSVTQFIRGSLRAYYNPSAGEKVFTEEHLAELCGLDRKHSLQDFSVTAVMELRSSYALLAALPAIIILSPAIILMQKVEAAAGNLATRLASIFVAEWQRRQSVGLCAVAGASGPEIPANSCGIFCKSRASAADRP